MEVETVQGVAQTGGQISLWHLVWQASLPVQIVMLGLAIASVWSWAIIFEKFFVVRRVNTADDRFEQSFWSGQSLEDLYLTLGSRDTMGLASIFMSAMREWKRSQESALRAGFQGVQKRIEKVMDVQIQKEVGPGRIPPVVPGNRRFGGAVRRPFRHGVGHHDELPGHRQFPEYQPFGGRAGYRRGAFRNGTRPSRRHTSDNLLQ